MTAMSAENPDYCVKCVLNTNFPSVRLDDSGVCNYCRRDDSLGTVLAEPTAVAPEASPEGYHVILAYSGGKDSSYTLAMLRQEYNLRVLALTVDNGYLSEETLPNVKRVCASLGVDSLVVAPSQDLLDQTFRYANDHAHLPMRSLERASAICTYCIGLVKMIVYREAILRRIPWIAFGWTPGQTPSRRQLVKLNSSQVDRNFSLIRQTLNEGLGDEAARIVLGSGLLEGATENMPSLFYPFPGRDYDESEIIRRIEELGWIRPTDTDANSSNCLLNTFGIREHMKKLGFHPYALELATLVRNGSLPRDVALAKVNEPIDDAVVESVRQRLYGSVTEGSLGE